MHLCFSFPHYSHSSHLTSQLTFSLDNYILPEDKVSKGIRGLLCLEPDYIAGLLTGGRKN